MRLLCSLVLLAFSAAAQAGWWVSGDLESFKWQEAGSPTVTEKGPRYGVGWGFAWERPAGWQWAYRGEFRRGTVDYTGVFLFSGQPTTARVRYTGLVNEGQGIYRLAHPLGVEFVGGLGVDYWERNILPDQKEDYSVVFLRLGVNLDPREAQGWFGGAGVKYPFHTREDAHLTDIGFNSNPSLQPKGDLSLYAQAGYRFSRSWSLTGYYDSYRFKESDPTPTVVNPFAPPSDKCRTGCNLFQPASTINTYGLKLQYNFR
jgi:hypothetical protein